MITSFYIIKQCWYTLVFLCCFCILFYAIPARHKFIVTLRVFHAAGTLADGIHAVAEGTQFADFFWIERCNLTGTFCSMFLEHADAQMQDEPSTCAGTRKLCVFFIIVRSLNKIELALSGFYAQVLLQCFHACCFCAGKNICLSVLTLFPRVFFIPVYAELSACVKVIFRTD